MSRPTNDKYVQVSLHVDVVGLDLGPPVGAPVGGLPLGLQVFYDDALVPVFNHLQEVRLRLLCARRNDGPRLNTYNKIMYRSGIRKVVPGCV